jgi:hypothetical protein
MTPGQQHAWVTALSAQVLPAGDWALYGAEKTVLSVLGSPRSIPAHGEIVEAALQFLRAGGVWLQWLSPAEQAYWGEKHPLETWSEASGPPSREAAAITPLPLYEERKLTVLSRARDANATYVVHAAPDRYLWQLEYVNGDGVRARDDRVEDAQLFDLYLQLGRNIFPGVWVDPEFAPFLPHPLPRL